jgi:hypothetical protein
MLVNRKNIKFRDWLILWVNRGVDKYAFSDGSTVMLDDEDLPKYFYKEEVVALPEKPPVVTNPDPITDKFYKNRQDNLREKLGISL